MLTQAALKDIPTDQLQTLSKLVTAEILARVGTPVSPPLGMPQRAKISDFRIGQRVKFIGRGGVPTVITIERINGKSLTGKTDSPDCRGWRVSPALCTAV